MIDLSALVQDRREMPDNLVLVRKVAAHTGASDRLVEIYAFGIVYGEGNEHVVHSNIAEVISERRLDALALWNDGLLADISYRSRPSVLCTEAGLLPDKEREIADELERRGASLLSYHPHPANAREIREQFFARAKLLDIMLATAYGRSFEIIADKPRIYYAIEMSIIYQPKPFQKLKPPIQPRAVPTNC